ncbi:MAG TPA: M28 family peptidase, partial [Solirubrobacteraceae bacterium]|nr:M28 family peptidase [Solirubrobacteraceae bacterium]
GTVVLVAHVDAAHTGLVWHPAVVRLGAERHLRRRSVDAFLAPVAGALLAGAAAAVAPPLRAPAALVLAAAAALNLEVARGATVPGADDNATGVAVLLDLVRGLAAEPLAGVDVVAVCPGGEEAGMGGFHAALGALAGGLDPARTVVVGLDTLGAGTPIVAAAEGALRTHRYREADLALAAAGAARAGEPAPQRWRIGGWTDPLLALRSGLPAVSLLSMGPGYFPHYHHPTDLPEHVDWDCVARCGRIAAGTVLAAAERLRGPAGGGW